ncbi:hypothetical protein E2986_05263 [Frieseomelitta varia]|uniref:Plastocyanin-like domain-containing protein n=1 Tax=Frieseomelitta varia TaxID=561572 RepID=A0A833VSN8_9HYME|nr:hypothetical protein E2986_05263 [Frieseomelitta varia]
MILNPSGVDCDNNPEEICISKLKSGTPIDEGLTQPETDLQFYIPVGFINYDTKDLFQPNRYDTFLSAVPPAVSAATLDGIIYANPPSPLISQISDIPSDQVCNSQNLPSKCNGNCSCTNTLKFPLNSTVEIILVDSYYVKQLDENGGIKRNSDGPGKDTLAVPNNGYAVLRIRANNPANHVIVINDWFKEESTNRFPGRRAGVIRQVADTFLINGKGKFVDPTGSTTNIPYEVITVGANHRYRFRLINSFCTVCPGELIIEGHSLTVIATDGQPIEPTVVNSIVSLAGERYDFIIDTNRVPGAYWIQLRGLNDCDAKGIQQLAILQYEGAPTKPMTKEPTFKNPIPKGVVLDIASSDCSSRICGDKLRNALPIDPDILKNDVDMKLYLPIASQKYQPEEIFVPNTYNNFLGKI